MDENTERDDHEDYDDASGLSRVHTLWIGLGMLALALILGAIYSSGEDSLEGAPQILVIILFWVGVAVAAQSAYALRERD